MREEREIRCGIYYYFYSIIYLFPIFLTRHLYFTLLTRFCSPLVASDFLWLHDASLSFVFAVSLLAIFQIVYWIWFSLIPPLNKRNHTEGGSHFVFILHIIWHVVISLSSFKMLLIGEVDLYYTLNSSASS